MCANSASFMESWWRRDPVYRKLSRKCTMPQYLLNSRFRVNICKHTRPIRLDDQSSSIFCWGLQTRWDGHEHIKEFIFVRYQGSTISETQNLDHKMLHEDIFVKCPNKKCLGAVKELNSTKVIFKMYKQLWAYCSYQQNSCVQMMYTGCPQVNALKFHQGLQRRFWNVW